MRVTSLFVSLAVVTAVVGCRKVTPVDEIVAPAGSTGPELTPAAASPGDWPWWRGPHQNGVAEEQPAPTSWSESDHVLWKAPVPGRGHSSPSPKSTSRTAKPPTGARVTT